MQTDERRGFRGNYNQAARNYVFTNVRIYLFAISLLLHVLFRYIMSYIADGSEERINA